MKSDDDTCDSQIFSEHLRNCAQETQKRLNYLQEMEATLHCISSLQEAVPLEDNPHLRRLFGPEDLGKLPTSGADKVRRTAVILLGR